MASHSYHEDIKEAGLADGCERCAEHASHPFASLDDENLRLLVQRFLDGGEARTENEAIALLQVAAHFGRQERLARLGF